VEKGGREEKKLWLEMVAAFSSLEEQNFGLQK
jgi:hypothetical protein